MADIGGGIQALNLEYIPFSGRTSAGTPRGDFAAEMNRALETARGSLAEAESSRGPQASEGPEFQGKTMPEAPSKEGVHIDRDSKLYEQCVALETFLVKDILSGMRKNVLKSELLDSGYAGEIYEDMLWDEYAKTYTEKGGFGLAELAYLELTNQRGKQTAGRLQ
ncbi:MAG: rod-binding protein [Spirochaetaceae bacterium]|jgi:flagellar protein FlgJ|nr:rod-binding protein [Spirochaetaceae bacterium]